MKVCIIPVCYNAHGDALRFLESLNRAFLSCSALQVDVVLADNSTILPGAGELDRKYAFSYKYQKNDNVGYFPAFNRGLSVLPEPGSAYDFVVVCNVDLVVAGDFFCILSKKAFESDVGLIAPGIFSDKDGRDMNPKIMRRPTAAKINFMRLVCSNVVLFRWYHKLVRLREQARSRSQQKKSIDRRESKAPAGQKMYGAHGSFMIFTKQYFRQGADVDYPRFLFGEEGFVAEQLRRHNLVIEHVPALRVFDKEHASTSQVKLKFLCAEHKKSYDYFYRHFLKGGS